MQTNLLDLEVTFSTVHRIFVHCGQSCAVEMLVAIKEDFLRTFAQQAAKNAAGTKVSFGNAKLEEILKVIGPDGDDNSLMVRDEWAKFASLFLGAWAMAVAIQGTVPLTPDEAVNAINKAKGNQ